MCVSNTGFVKSQQAFKMFKVELAEGTQIEKLKSIHLGLKFIFKYNTFKIFLEKLLLRALNYKLLFIFFNSILFSTKKLKTVHFVMSSNMRSTHVWHSQKFQKAKSLIGDLLWNGT